MIDIEAVMGMLDGRYRQSAARQLRQQAGDQIEEWILVFNQGTYRAFPAYQPTRWETFKWFWGDLWDRIIVKMEDFAEWLRN